ncbi:MAG TPA: hypothetical protein VK449_00845, partial [Anaerolineales bacterium]|nr:hypothetical protein [Anaerolineales bacterium]
DDSYSYLQGAEMLANQLSFSRRTGEGDLNPITNFPPGYPMALALLRLAGGGGLANAATLNQVLFGLLLLLLGTVMWLSTRAWWAALLAPIMAVLSVSLVSQFTWAQSEPLFLVLVEASVLSLLVYLTTGRRLALAATGLALSTAVLTRYAGIGMVAGAMLVLLLDRGTPRRRRLADALTVFLFSAVPLGLFLLRNQIVARDIANRPALAWHPPSPEAWRVGAVALLGWLSPDRWVAALGDRRVVVVAAVLVGLGTAGALWVVVRQWARVSAKPASLVLASILAALGLGYAGFLLATVLVVDRLVPLNDRLLSPLLLLLLQAGVLAVAWLSTRLRSRLRWALAALVVAFGAFNLFRQVALVRSLREDGQGYAARAWRDSPTLEYACSLPDIPIYSNDLPAIYFSCGRIARTLPNARNAATGASNPAFDEEVHDLLDSVLRQGAVVVIVGWYGEDRLARLGADSYLTELSPTKAFPDGIVFVRPSQPLEGGG